MAIAEKSRRPRLESHAQERVCVVLGITARANPSPGSAFGRDDALLGETGTRGHSAPISARTKTGHHDWPEVRCGKLRAPFASPRARHTQPEARRRPLRTREMIEKSVAKMKTADFRGELTPNGQIAVPPEVLSQVPSGESIQVILQWGSSDDHSAWRMAGRRQFESAYATDDSIYELLIHDPSTR